MTYSELVAAKERIKKLNRSLGQLRRRFIWNYERIVKAERERRRLQREVEQYGPRLEAWNAEFWS